MHYHREHNFPANYVHILPNKCAEFKINSKFNFICSELLKLSACIVSMWYFQSLYNKSNNSQRTRIAHCTRVFSLIWKHSLILCIIRLHGVSLHFFVPSCDIPLLCSASPCDIRPPALEWLTVPLMPPRRIITYSNQRTPSLIFQYGRLYSKMYQDKLILNSIITKTCVFDVVTSAQHQIYYQNIISHTFIQ